MRRRSPRNLDLLRHGHGDERLPVLREVFQRSAPTDRARAVTITWFSETPSCSARRARSRCRLRGILRWTLPEYSCLSRTLFLRSIFSSSPSPREWVAQNSASSSSLPNSGTSSKLCISVMLLSLALTACTSPSPYRSPRERRSDVPYRPSRCRRRKYPAVVCLAYNRLTPLRPHTP